MHATPGAKASLNPSAQCEWLTPFDVAKLPPQPWRNGAGVTREILAHPSPESWLWRVSLADNARAGPFSAFPGVDRAALLFAGGPLTLHDDAGKPAAHFSQAGDICRFAGEARLHSELPHGGAQLLNVMTRRGHARATLAWYTGHHATTLALPATHACVLIAASGRWQIDVHADDETHAKPHDLGAGEGLHITLRTTPRTTLMHLRLQGLTPGGALAYAVLSPC